MDQQLNGIILDLYNEAQSDHSHLFGTSSLRKVKDIIPFDSAGNTTLSFTSAGNATITGYATVNVDSSKMALRAEFIGPETFNKKTGITSRDPLLKMSVRNPRRVHRITTTRLRDKNIVEYSRRAAAVHCLCYVNKSDDSNLINTVSFWREEKSGAFSDAQLAFSSILTPHVIQALTINQKIKPDIFVGSKERSGRIIAEVGGAIHFIDDISIILLRQEFPLWLSHVLPPEIIAGFRSNSFQKYIGKKVILSLQLQGNIMFMDIKTRDVGGSLTSAELRVVEKIVLCGNYKEAARQLEVSASTIRNQLHSIYKKLGIRGKSELIKNSHYLK